MRFSICLIILSALMAPVAQAAESGTVKGDGYRVERTSPARKKIKVMTPEGATVRILQRGSKELAKGIIPFEYAPTETNGEYQLEVSLADGESWWKGSLRVQDRTEYQVFVDGPKEPEREQRHRHTRRDVPQPPLPRAVPPPPIVPTPAPLPAPTGMTSEDFESLKTAIKGESFSSTKMDVLKTGAKSQTFTIAQVGELVDLFDFGNDKVTVVQTLSKQIVDPKNAFKLYSHFTFDSEKTKVKKILEK